MKAAALHVIMGAHWGRGCGPLPLLWRRAAENGEVPLTPVLLFQFGLAITQMPLFNAVMPIEITLKNSGRVGGLRLLAARLIQTPAQFHTPDSSFKGRRETKLNLVATDRQYGQADVITDDNLFTYLASQDQH